MWLFFALAAAVFEALRIAAAKNGTRSFHPIVVTWCWLVFSLPILLPILLLDGIPEVTDRFWFIFMIRMVLDTVALLLYVKAIEIGEISIVSPLASLGPVLVLINSSFLNGEVPTLFGILGVFIVVIGVYLLNYKKSKRSIFAPLAAIFNDRGAFYAIIAYIVWSVNASAVKAGIQESSDGFMMFAGALGLSIIFTPFALIASRENFVSAFKPANLRILIPIGILDGIFVAFYFHAIEITLNAYASAVKNFSIVFATLLGWYFFKEKIHDRIVPIMIIVAGIILISVSELI